MPAQSSAKPERSKAEARMIKVMTDRGEKGFRVLRSAETGFKHYQRPQPR